MFILMKIQNVYSYENSGQAPFCPGQGVKFWDCSRHFGTVGNYAIHCRDVDNPIVNIMYIVIAQGIFFFLDALST